MKKIEDFDESQFSGHDENTSRTGVGINGGRSPVGFKTLPNSATRKKILAERNGVSHCQNPNSPNSSSRKHPTSWSSKDQFRVSPCSFKISKSDHGHENGEDESASYDPMNNFLSPRPKFLRYDPNRRRENFPGPEKMKDFDLETLVGSMGLDSQSETEQGESSDCSCVSANPFSLDEALLKEAIGENVEDNNGFEKDEEEEETEMEEEEEEEGDRWVLKWALKFMLVLVGLVLSTAYISTMNSPTPLPAVLAVRGLRDECQRFGGGLMKYFHEMKDFAGEGGRLLFDGRKDVGAVFFGAEQMRYLYEIKDFAVERGRLLFDGRKGMGASLFELNESNSDGKSEVENFKEEVKDSKEEMVVRNEDGEAKEKNFKEEISDVAAVQGENDMIPEEFDTVGDFDEFLFQEERVVETEAADHNPKIQEDSSEFYEDQIVSNGRDEFLLRLKENPLLAVCSLLAVCASLVLTSCFKFKRSSVETNGSANVLEAMKKPEVAKGAGPNKNPFRPPSPPRLHQSISPNVLEAIMKNLEVAEAEPKRTPRRPPTPPRPHKSISPDVKLISELEVGNFRSPVQNLSPTRSGKSEFTKEKIIVQKEDVRQRIADLSLSGGSTTPVRRSARIRNRVTSP